MRSLKQLPHDQLLTIFENAHLALNNVNDLNPLLKEGECVTIMIMSPTVVGFTLCVRDGKINWSMQSNDGNPRMIWKEMKHYLEWLEGKRGMMKLMFIGKLQIDGSVPGWVSAMATPLRDYIRSEILEPKKADSRSPIPSS